MTDAPNALRRDLFRALRFLFLPAIGLGFVLLFLPGRAGLAIRVFALILCAAGLILMVAALRRSVPRATPLRRPARRLPRTREVPETLSRLETRAALGVAGAFDLHYRLRPRLRELATELLSSRRGISLDEEPDRARRVLGEETWELVREDRPGPEDRLAHGVPIRELARVVESLENV